MLNLLPFDALREPSGNYVGEHKVISYLPSAGSFYLLARQDGRSIQNKKVFAMGGVPYEQSATHFRDLIATHGLGPSAVLKPSELA